MRCVRHVATRDRYNALYPAAEIKHGIHGGQIETSMMLYLHPGLVKMELAENLTPLSVTIEGETNILGTGAIKFGWQAQDLNIRGACGDATKATADLGKETLERTAARLIMLSTR